MFKGGVASRISVRTLSSVAALAIVGAIGVSAALVWITDQQEATIQAIIRDSQSRTIAGELERFLLMYQRVSNHLVLTGEQALLGKRDELANQIHVAVAEAKNFVGEKEESDLLLQIERDIEQFLLARQTAEARSKDLREVIDNSRADFARAMVGLDALRELNRQQVNEVHRSAQNLDHLGNVIGWIAACLLVCGFFIAALVTRRFFVRPILAIHGAMSRFRDGDTSARSSEHGLRELAQLAAGFNAMAESLAQQKRQEAAFLAGVAHDLRNPLTAMKLSFHVLQGDLPRPQRERGYQRLERQLDQLTRLVDDLLDSKGIEAGHLQCFVEEFDLKELIEDVAELSALTSQKHKLVVDCRNGPICIRADAIRIRQVLTNLISNAIKFSPDGGEVTIRVHEESSGVCFSVSDQGVGISEKQEASVFLPFQRMRPDIAPGVGLGLAVVRQIIDSHGGTLTLDRNVGKGTTFHVRLPQPPRGGEGEAASVRTLVI